MPVCYVGLLVVDMEYYMKFEIKRIYKLNSYISLQIWNFLLSIDFRPFSDRIEYGIEYNNWDHSLCLILYPFEFYLSFYWTSKNYSEEEDDIRRSI